MNHIQSHQEDHEVSELLSHLKPEAIRTFIARYAAANGSFKADMLE